MASFPAIRVQRVLEDSRALAHTEPRMLVWLVRSYLLELRTWVWPEHSCLLAENSSCLMEASSRNLENSHCRMEVHMKVVQHMGFHRMVEHYKADMVLDNYCE